MRSAFRLLLIAGVMAGLMIVVTAGVGRAVLPDNPSVVTVSASVSQSHQDSSLSVQRVAAVPANLVACESAGAPCQAQVRADVTDGAAVRAKGGSRAMPLVAALLTLMGLSGIGIILLRRSKS